MAKQDALTLRDYRAGLERAVAELPHLVVIYGDSEFLRHRAVIAFRDAWLFVNSGGDTVQVRGAGDSKSSLLDVIAELSGGSLFAAEKMVLVRQAEKILFPAAVGDGDATGSRLEREKAFLDFLERPAARISLVLETGSLPKNRTLGKKIAALCAGIPCPNPNAREIPVWLSGEARNAGKRLTPEAAEMLQTAHGADLGLLAGEVEKLALFAGESEDIDARMVGEFLTGTVEFDIFSFTNALEARNLSAAVHFARRIGVQGARDQKGKKEGGERSAHRVMALVAGSVQSLLKARVALAARQNAASFASSEKLSPWRAEKLLEAAGRFGLPELRRLAAFTADQLRRSHDTGGDALLSLELLAVHIAGGDNAGDRGSDDGR
jgi:DNA polymerase III, delta subunit